jgi:hydrogenase maturation factor
VTVPAVSGLADDLAAAALVLARRFAGGATLWCTSPRWPAHGRHVAVEFVHPVIVGKRALPAVSVDCDDVVGATRLLARPGDVVLAVGPADDEVVGSLLRRSQAWGLTSLWLGAGERPPAGTADHVIWIDDADVDVAARGGDVVMLYHLLWELTHVVFEHPGLLEDSPACTDDVCITCSDEGRVAEVAAVHEAGSAVVLAAGLLETVDVSLIDPVRPGDLVLVHAGVALTVLQEHLTVFQEHRS